MRSINLLKAKSHPRCIVKGLSGRKTARNICAAAAGAAGWSSELSVRFLCSCSTWKSFNKASLSAREAISVCWSWSERRLVYEGESSNLVLAFSHKLQTAWGESRRVNRCPLSHVAHSFNMLNQQCARACYRFWKSVLFRWGSLLRHADFVGSGRLLRAFQSMQVQRVKMATDKILNRCRHPPQEGILGVGLNNLHQINK